MLRSRRSCCGSSSLPLIPGLRKAATDLRKVNPALLVGRVRLQMAALFCYSLLTRAALGESRHARSRLRLFRIQMSTKALSSIVPGGSAAGSALGYRLMTLSGVQGADAGFALATAGLGSAVMLNVILWVGLIVSIPDPRCERAVRHGGGRRHHHHGRSPPRWCSG